MPSRGRRTFRDLHIRPTNLIIPLSRKIYPIVMQQSTVHRRRIKRPRTRPDGVFPRCRRIDELVPGEQSRLRGHRVRRRNGKTPSGNDRGIFAEPALRLLAQSDDLSCAATDERRARYVQHLRHLLIVMRTRIVMAGGSDLSAGTQIGNEYRALPVREDERGAIRPGAVDRENERLVLFRAFRNKFDDRHHVSVGDLINDTSHARTVRKARFGNHFAHPNARLFV